MCGIVGMCDWSGRHTPEVGLLRRMLGIIRHRGPDEYGLYLDHKVGLGSARLSIIDLSTGQQPIANEDRTLWMGIRGHLPLPVLPVVGNHRVPRRMKQRRRGCPGTTWCPTTEACSGHRRPMVVH